MKKYSEKNSFKVKLNSTSNSMNVKLNKTTNVFDDFKADFGGCKDEDIFYDEIIYYDGGGVDGYGYD